MAKHRRYSADREVIAKSDATLERETAKKWCARALACYRQFDRTGDRRWFARAVEYKHEAIEHAASVSGAFLESIRRQFKGR